MDSNIRYEIKARAFQRMTGEMAPGKDAPEATYPEPIEKRQAMWDAWLKTHGECAEAMLKAAEEILQCCGAGTEL